MIKRHEGKEKIRVDNYVDITKKSEVNNSDNLLCPVIKSSEQAETAINTMNVFNILDEISIHSINANKFALNNDILNTIKSFVKIAELSKYSIQLLESKGMDAIKSNNPHEINYSIDDILSKFNLGTNDYETLLNYLILLSAKGLTETHNMEYMDLLVKINSIKGCL